MTERGTGNRSRVCVMKDDPALESHQADTFQELLSTLAGALDVRGVFRRLSRIAARAVAHDEADLALLSDEGTRVRVHASTREGAGLPFWSADLTAPDLLIPGVFTDDLGAHHGFQSGLRVPVQVGGQAVGVLALLSRRRIVYTEHDLMLTRRVADYLALALAHQRLADVECRAVLARDRAANLENSVELLHAISGVLDIRTVFPQVSDIAKKGLAHDRLTMSFD